MRGMKKLSLILKTDQRHWVGDGFHVRNLFSYNDHAEKLSPFLLLDYAGPENFSPTDQRRGVGEHPHRGFETVTIVYEGEVEHRDSTGAGGKIGPGDIQWMTAASGVVHEEFHGPEYAKRGGLFELVQLWVNLPKKDKMSAPRYQGITHDQTPIVPIPNDAGTVRVIAGEYQGKKGPAQTFTPMNVWDLKLKAGQTVEFPFRNGDTTALLVLRGKVRVADASEEVKAAEIAVLEREGSGLRIHALDDTTALLLNGEPIPEPIVGYGPFVMNTEAEIRQAYSDYRSGKMGNLSNPA